MEGLLTKEESGQGISPDDLLDLLVLQVGEAPLTLHQSALPGGCYQFLSHTQQLLLSRKRKPALNKQLGRRCACRDSSLVSPGRDKAGRGFLISGKWKQLASKSHTHTGDRIVSTRLRAGSLGDPQSDK